MLADERLGANIHRLGAAPIERRICLAQRQQQKVDQRISDDGGVVRRKFRSLVKRGMHEVVGDSAGPGARRKFARRHSLHMEAAFPQQFLWHDDDVVPRQRWTDDRMRTRYVIGKAITRLELDAPPLLLEVRSSFRLEMYLDVGMLA